MPAPPVLLDECTHLGLVTALQARGFSVTSIQIIGPRGVDDEAVLSRAVELGRVLVTHNTVDFKAIHADRVRRGQPHTGIICLPQTRPFDRLELRAAMMLDWIADQPYASQLFLRGDLQRMLERGARLGVYSEEDVLHALGRT